MIDLIELFREPDHLMALEEFNRAYEGADPMHRISSIFIFFVSTFNMVAPAPWSGGERCDPFRRPSRGGEWRADGDGGGPWDGFLLSSFHGDGDRMPVEVLEHGAKAEGTLVRGWRAAGRGQVQ